MKINIDINKVEWEDNRKTWQFCVGSGNAKLALQADYQTQLTQVVSELGFKRVRFHGLFNDGLYTVRTLSDLFNVQVDTPNIKEISFQQITKVIDSVLACGAQPYIEVGMMPKLFSRDNKTIFQYKDYISPPKKYEDWNDLVKKFVEYIDSRYGTEEIETWFFEVWNEPDVDNFFSGTQLDYFELYENTVRTIKSINPNLKVGGPSTAKSRWIDEFIEYCKEKNIPYDFVSTHQYPGDALGHSFNREKHENKMNTILSRSYDSMLEVARDILYSSDKVRSYSSNLLLNNAIIARNKVGKKPLYYTEWNVTSICVAPENDGNMNASYIVKTCLDVDNIIDGSSYWTFSDIFEELAYFTDPFYGGFGLVTIDGIEKPNYYAFKFLSELGDKKSVIYSDEHVHVSIHMTDRNNIQIIMTNHYFDENNSEKWDYTFEFLNQVVLKEITYKAINMKDSNAYEEWKNLGKPKPLKKSEIEYLRDFAVPNEYSHEFIAKDDRSIITGTLDVNEVKLISIKI